MRIETVSRAEVSEATAPKAVVVFLGWGMDAGVVRGLSRRGYDVVAVWDYAPRQGSDLDGEEAAVVGTAEGFEGFEDFGELDALLSAYGEVAVVAWSFGVRVAAEWLRRTHAPVTRRVAVNGTPWHVDARRGIPPDIFRATLAGLSPVSVEKFMRRMFATGADYREFSRSPRVPRRSFESRLDELGWFGALSPWEGEPCFDKAVIGERDLIFPPDNQRRAWQGAAEVETVAEWGHIPDFQALLERELIDKCLVAERFSAARATYSDHAEVQRRVAARLWEMVQPMLPLATAEPPRILEIGVGAGLLTALYAGRYPQAQIDLWDIAEVDTRRLPDNARFRRCDAERALREAAPSSYDIIVSSSTLQWFNSPVRALGLVRRALRRGGAAAISLFVEGTCGEISALTGVGLPYPSARAVEAETRRVFLGRDGGGGTEFEEGKAFKCETEALGIDFASPLDLLRHLRLTGVNAVAASPSAALRLARELPERPRLTYRACYVAAGAG